MKGLKTQELIQGVLEGVFEGLNDNKFKGLLHIVIDLIDLKM